MYISLLPNLNIRKQLEAHIKERATTDTSMCIISSMPVPAYAVRGDNSKLKALADALWIRNTQRGLNYRFPILYKYKSQQLSMRAMAKKLGSVTGEVNSTEILQTICAVMGYNSTVHHFTNPDEYIFQLKTILKSKLSAIVFYNSNQFGIKAGHPVIGAGDIEQAAVVIGCYQDQDDDTRFIVTINNVFLDLDGRELALSACKALKDKIPAETYTKYWDYNQGQSMWHKITPNGPFGEHLSKRKRTSQANADPSSTFKGKILQVTTPMSQHGFDEYLLKTGAYIPNALRANQSSSTATRDDKMGDEKTIITMAEAILNPHKTLNAGGKPPLEQARGRVNEINKAFNQLQPENSSSQRSLPSL